MISRDFLVGKQSGKEIMRIKICKVNRSKFAGGKIVINKISKDNVNMKVKIGVGEMKELIRLFEKQEL